MGTAQEVLHSLHSKKVKGMILKVDLSKAFDIANWLYIRMLLTHLGFPFDFIKWIMSCISDILFSILIYGQLHLSFILKEAFDRDAPYLHYFFS